MSDTRRAENIARKSGDELTEQERKEFRYVNDLILWGKKDDGVRIEILGADQKKVADLSWALGWIPATARNWRGMAFAMALAVFIGGQKLIDNIAKMLGGYLP